MRAFNRKGSGLLLLAALLGALFFSCQKAEEGSRIVNLFLDDTLGVGTYDSITVDVLDTNGNPIQAGIFSGPYQPGADHKLSGLVLPDNTPEHFVLRIIAYQGAVRKIEFTIQVGPVLVDNPVVVYRAPRDTSAPSAPILQTVSPARMPYWDWAMTEPGLTYSVRLTHAGQTRDSQLTMSNSYLGKDSVVTSEGPWTLHVIAIDSAGNRSQASFAPITVDLTPPNLTITGPTALGRVTGVDPVITGMATDSAGVPGMSYQPKGADFLVPVTVGTGGIWSFTANSLPAGPCTLLVSAYDPVGNSRVEQVVIHKWPKVAFLRAGATGRGNSWADAAGNIDSVLNMLRTGTGAVDEYWMDSGTYAGPTRTFSGKRTFLGGFTTASVRAADRNPALHRATIRGIAANRGFAPSNDLVVDGIRFHQCSNALFTSYLRGKVEFRNCDFEAGSGPMAYIGYNPDSGSMSFINCRFNSIASVSANSSLIYLEDMFEVLFDSCTFQGNPVVDTTGHIAVEAGSLIVRNSFLLDSPPAGGAQIRYLPYASPEYPNGNLEIRNSQVRGGRASVRTTLSSFIYQNNTDL